MSGFTELAIIHTYAEMVESIPADRITVSDLCRRCGIQRQTFYYHFADINQLVEAIYDRLGQEILEDNKTYDTWQEGLLDLMLYLQKNKPFVTATYHSSLRARLEPFLLQQTRHLLLGVVQELSEGYSISAEQQESIADFYKYGFVGTMLDWVSKGMTEAPQAVVTRVETIIQGSFLAAVKRFSTSDNSRKSHN